ncbi:tyrosine-protein phosphatase non-receptor type substrate 1-like isoform X1 [Mytilus edulis]|uniref:tyrosine-protein phosphatase non-receptor type substrate 1-like isoform X1 n=1 Tax=Mytilus edulis TaxID=6550 RepID=UPI0039F0CB3F
MERRKQKISYGLMAVFGSLKDAVLIQIILFSCWHVVSMTTYNPVFNHTPVNLTYYTGETATLRCSVSHLGPSKVIWKREDQPHPLTVGKFVYVSNPEYGIKHIPYKDEWNLIIENVQPSHAGFYECQISTKDDIKRYVQLHIIDEPGHDRRYINITGPTRATKGQSVKLTCNVSGFRRTPKHIRWFLNGTHIVNGQDHNIRIVTYQRSDVFSLFSELDIGKTNLNYGGNYLCQAHFANGLKVSKHVLLVDTINADSKPSKRGTVADGTERPVLQRNKQQTQNTALSYSVTLWCLSVCSLVSLLCWF